MEAPAFRLRLGTRRVLLGVFVLYIYGLLGYLGVSHRHESEASHPDCQLCHIAAQPSLAQAPELPVQPVIVAFTFVSAEIREALAPRHAASDPRGPPSA